MGKLRNLCTRLFVKVSGDDQTKAVETDFPKFELILFLVCYFVVMCLICIPMLCVGGKLLLLFLLFGCKGFPAAAFTKKNERVMKCFQQACFIFYYSAEDSYSNNAARISSRCEMNR